ncbi:hypothetical protein EHW66_20770 [Erwinia psidii]|uniref:hypothetical protein n=1 Tax=Erwinia psidii TaxID=69224 RepID=UPI00226B8E6F|nr:hypothetical protein [Erwinia psidii]MCX8967316.1 hypothetical protein [Erwinia psidii]
MQNKLMVNAGAGRKNNIFLAEHQVGMINALITRFEKYIIRWWVDYGYDKMTINYRGSETGDIDHHLYSPERAKFARDIPWKTI